MGESMFADGRQGGRSMFAKPAPKGGYVSQISPQEQSDYQAWIAQSGMQDESGPQAHYDMPGYWRALVAGDPRAMMQENPNDHSLHQSDYWKTPYDPSFSNESQWATKGAPAWNEMDQLVLPGGKVVYDERANAQRGK